MAAKASPEGELKYAVELINRLTEGFDDVLFGVHVCRGNWSQQEDVLLQGGYEPLVPWLAQMRVGQFALEYATPRAGKLEALADLQPGVSLGLGTVNPRTPEVESTDWIVDRARTAVSVLQQADGKQRVESASNQHSAQPASQSLPPERRVFLNPDCGFGTFGDRPIATTEGAYAKMQALVAAARRLRGQ